MSFGLRTWNAAGQARLDTNTWTFRVALTQYINLASGGSVSFTVPGLTPDRGTAFVVPAGAYDRRAVLPVVDVNGSTVTVRSSQKDLPSRPHTSRAAYLYVVFFK